MLRESFDWLKPSPLWQGGLDDARNPGFFQPQLLEFDDDDFIGAFRKAVASGPAALQACLRTSKTESPLKLFQPAHGCHYLVSAELACRVPGLPNRAVQKASGESVFFVIRRFAAGQEFGWVVNGTKKTWQAVGADPRSVLANEERLPLFTARTEGVRTLFVGYVPAASREVYAVPVSTINAELKASDPAEYPNGIDLRLETFGAVFATPIRRYGDDLNPGNMAPGISVFMVLDLWEFLDTNIPAVAVALRDNPASGFTGPLAAAEQTLMTFLAGQNVGGGQTLAQALGAVARQQAKLEAAADSDLAALGFNGYSLVAIDTNGLEAAIAAALPPADPAATIVLPRQGTITGETYAIRCVYDRPHCTLTREVVSPISDPFAFANFFDSDAPARPVRIVMPTDISLSHMRKFKKGVTFMISSSLQQKINMVAGLENKIFQSGTPTVGPDSGGIAWMCSFSIQIIFIIAFFLLLMFVIIFNICFFWIAFFRICIPIPKKFLPG